MEPRQQGMAKPGCACPGHRRAEWRMEGRWAGGWERRYADDLDGMGSRARRDKTCGLEGKVPQPDCVLALSRPHCWLSTNHPSLHTEHTGFPACCQVRP